MGTQNLFVSVPLVSPGDFPSHSKTPCEILSGAHGEWRTALEGGHCACCPLEERGPETVLLKSGCGPEHGGPAGPSHHRRGQDQCPSLQQEPRSSAETWEGGTDSQEGCSIPSGSKRDRLTLF